MIVLVVENNDWVIVYNENKDEVFRKNGKLYNYTENTVAIKVENVIEVYDEKVKKFYLIHMI